MRTQSWWVMVVIVAGCGGAQRGAGGTGRPMSECEDNKRNVQSVAQLHPEASVQLAGRYRCVITDVDSTHVETDGFVTFTPSADGTLTGTFDGGGAWSGKIMGDTYYALTDGNYPTVMLQAAADGSSASGNGVNVETSDLGGPYGGDFCTLYSYACDRIQ